MSKQTEEIFANILKRAAENKARRAGQVKKQAARPTVQPLSDIDRVNRNIFFQRLAEVNEKIDALQAKA